MKRLMVLLGHTSLFFFSVIYCAAQTNRIVTVGLPITLTQPTETPELEGSQYLFDDWKSGALIMNDSSVHTLDLKFNIYTDEILFLNEDKTYAFPSKSVLKGFKVGNLSFTRELGDFYQILSDGNSLQLLKKYFCSIEKGKPATGMLPSSYDRYVRYESYYVKDKRSNLLEDISPKVSSMKENILVLMSDKRQMVEEFIKKEKLKVRDEEDLVRIFDFYNSLNN